MKKYKWKKRLISFVLLAGAVVAFVEFDKWQKSRVEPCASGVCPIPRDTGLTINPFPEEIVPKGSATNKPTPASDPLSKGGELNRVQTAIPSAGGVREAQGGLPATNQFNEGTENE